MVEIARHARFSWFESRDDPKRNGSAGEHGRELAPGEGWLRRIGGSGMPAIPVGFDYLSCWGSGARPGWVAEVELYPVDCRARELRAGAYSLKLAGTGGTTRTVVLSRPQSGDRWHGEVMRLRTSPSRSTRDSSLDRLFQTHG